LLIVDDYTRFMWLEVLRSKDEALSFFKKVKARAEAERECRLLAFRSDRGGEFNSLDFADFCDASGIRHNTTAPYSPQQNGVVERRNQTVVEMARCLLKSVGMPGPFWGEAVKTAVYLLNRAPSRSLKGMTPYQAWHGRAPAVHHLRIFGCVAHVKRLGPGITKLADRSVPGVFVGYEEGSKAYRVYDPKGKRLYITRDVAFEENRAWDWSSSSGGQIAGPPAFIVDYSTCEEGESSTAASATTSAAAENSPQNSAVAGYSPPTAAAAGPSARSESADTPSPAQVQFATPPSQDPNLDTDSDGPHRYRRVDDVYEATVPFQDLDEESTCLLAAEEPASVEEALEEECWREAMKEELRSIVDNNTWQLTALPGGHRAIGLKWVFKAKKNPAGEIVKHKARLVAKGYAQRQGVDFEEVFAPVARMETVRALLALAAHNGWHVHHMDVKSAFLNGELAEEVYVVQPPGFVDDKQPRHVLKLTKALYGLRQAPRAWYEKLDASLSDLGFSRSAVEHAVYRRKSTTGFLLVGVYVDDLIITGTNEDDIQKFKDEMHNLFKMSDLGQLSYYLGIEVKQEKGEITLCQQAYAAKILEKAGMKNCNPCHTPMECRLKLSKDDGAEKVDATMYRSVIGSLRYLVNTRPDIAHAVGIASRYMEAPSTSHWAVVKQILRYLQGTLSYGCRYKAGGETVLTGYSDSDFAGDIDDRKSTMGVVFFLGDNLVTWSAQKQKTVALSSCEAEYVAASTAACQGIWLNRLVKNLSGRAQPKFKLLIDNQSAIELCKNPVQHGRSKHIDPKYHHIRECIENGELEVDHVSTNR
jgi:hypothetical protein